MRFLLLAGRCVQHNQLAQLLRKALAQLQSALPLPPTTYVYARHAPAAEARGAWSCWAGRLARRESLHLGEHLGFL